MIIKFRQRPKGWDKYSHEEKIAYVNGFKTALEQMSLYPGKRVILSDYIEELNKEIDNG